MRFGLDRPVRPAFADRFAAGKELAHRLEQRKLPPPVVVLALPRGGVAVARPVARALHAPLDLLVVRKVSMPGQPELAIGAIAGGGIVVRDHLALFRRFGSSARDDEVFERAAALEREELKRREAVYRPGCPPLDLKGKTAVIVDDGLATGFTMVAAVRAARKAGARTIVAAAPVASCEAVQRLGTEADEIVVVTVPGALFSIGEWYDRFEQLTDAEVSRLLDREHQVVEEQNG